MLITIMLPVELELNYSHACSNIYLPTVVMFLVKVYSSLDAKGEHEKLRM